MLTLDWTYKNMSKIFLRTADTCDNSHVWNIGQKQDIYIANTIETNVWFSIIFPGLPSVRYPPLPRRLYAFIFVFMDMRNKYAGAASHITVAVFIWLRFYQRIRDSDLRILNSSIRDYNFHKKEWPLVRMFAQWPAASISLIPIQTGPHENAKRFPLNDYQQIIKLATLSTV